MDSVKYIGMDVHKEAISIAVLNSSGKLVMESTIETKASTILEFLGGLRGSLRVTFEEGTWAAWLYWSVVSYSSDSRRRGRESGQCHSQTSVRPC
jgi:hypothetical protein